MLRGPQGNHTHRDRWLRERKRSPAIAAVTVGTVLVRNWRGKDVHVECHDGYWAVNSPVQYASDKQFATLYAVTLYITRGRRFPRADQKRAKRLMSNWSAARFFKLDSKIGSAIIENDGNTQEEAAGSPAEE
jgi:hypothetical protein